MSISPSSRSGSDALSARLFMFLALVFLMGLPGCAARTLSALEPGIEKRGHYIRGVPFYRQTESTCGPAALAGVLAFWGSSVEQEEITSRIYLPELRGTLPMDIHAYAEKQGFHSSSSSGTLDRLKETIRKGTPVICLIDLGFSLYRKPHYVIAAGYDDKNRMIVMHDGSVQDRLMNYAAFNKAWDRAGRWMIVITPGPAGKEHVR